MSLNKTSKSVIGVVNFIAMYPITFFDGRDIWQRRKRRAVIKIRKSSLK